MSEKKVIHVKDLVIKADNVIIDRGPRRHRDPLFGPPRRMERMEESLESSHERESGERRDDGEDRRRSFSWI